MIRLEISPEAFMAIIDSLSEEETPFPPVRGPAGGFYVWLTKSLAERLHAHRRPYEGLSEVILRLAELEALARGEQSDKP